MNDSDLLQHLRHLEVALHQPLTRSDRGRLDELLDDEFLEFGKSGARLTKADILEWLPVERRADTIWSEGYEIARLAEDIALLTYRAAQADDEGNLSAHTLRSSLWIHSARGWRIRFHQGTATEAFRQCTN
ncbi:MULTISPECIES: DUF4440 domain-containing protein [unclassified Modicisalibacter]|uniref:nuclear transport factor 2 family protein n=1 Tax=unclassified Modicisalibacter TaxID=2679913 RepID=UPI001CCED934|nr:MULTISPECIES: DUF4440 domain-containing protein [unclassified Modicisalibacter]MBZ9559680.1 DUF4440 domain-containing protein [Modicisalibacter sp. R2A 31.J]MBZ9577132.1 DUF4440 domain-containing protein [Modicisalibacter sp. MOD 31.J]